MEKSESAANARRRRSLRGKEASVQALLTPLRGQEAWAGFPAVVAAYAFGSRCEGRDRPDSDLDIGVVFDPASGTVPDESRMLAPLERQLQRRAGKAHVDLVVLNRQALAFQYHVISKGRCLYERSRRDRAVYQANLLSRYFDFLPTLALIERYHTQGIRRRLGLK